MGAARRDWRSLLLRRVRDPVEGLALLSALALYQDAMEPGPGSFRLAESLGADLGSNERARWEFWIRNVKGAYEHWAATDRAT